MQALLNYLEETGASPDAFAVAIGVKPEKVRAALAGEECFSLPEARRIVEATDGAVPLAAALNADAKTLEDFRAGLEKARGGALASAIAASEDGADDVEKEGFVAAARAGLGALLDPPKDDLDRLASLGAEAILHTYLALQPLTTRRGTDRLLQALRPVLAEIHADYAGRPPAPDRLDAACRLAQARYLQTTENASTR